MLSDDREGAYLPSVIIIPWLRDSVVGCSEVPYKGEDTQVIYDHGQGISLGKSLLAVEEVTHPFVRPDH